MSNSKRFLSDSPADQDNLGTCKKTAQSLLSFALDSEGISPPFIIGLFGPWGSGKSSVLKLLEEEATKSDRVVTVQIDAWKKSKDSFLRDFLRGVTNKLCSDGVIEEGNESNQKGGLTKRITTKKLDQRTTWELKSHVKRILIYLIISFAIFLPSAWAISYWMQWKTFIDSITLPPAWVFQFALAGLVTFIVHLIITEGKVQNTSSSEPMDVTDPFKFREIFSSLVNAVSNEGKHLCISIDNLDRCEPDEAIEIMRRIKTFMVDDTGESPVTFIVACDDEALEKHLKQCFRQEPSSAKEFLRKFFNVSLRIPGIHPADMHDFIDSQLQAIFPSDGIIAVSKEQKKHLRLIVFASFSKTPRQVKQFINQLAAKLYLLRDIEKDGVLDKSKPTEAPEVVALYLAACNLTGRDGFPALDDLRSGRLHKNIRGRSSTSLEAAAIEKLYNLHLHEKVDRTLWAAIEQMKDPSTRQRWNHFADMYHAIEMGHFRDFMSDLNDVATEDRHELIEALLSECSYRNNEDAKQQLVRFILKPQVAEDIIPSQQISASLLNVIQKVDPRGGWSEWDGKALAHYIKGHASILAQLMDFISRKGQISNDSFNMDVLVDFLSEVVDKANSSQLSAIWTQSLDHVPEAVGLMVTRPDSIQTEHIEKLTNLWSNNIPHITALIKNDKLSEKIRVFLIESALGCNFSASLNTAQTIASFLEKGGGNLLTTLVQSLTKLDEPNTTMISQTITVLNTHLASIQDEEVKLQILELLGHILDIELNHKIDIFEPNSKASLPNVLWNEVSHIEPERLMLLFTAHPSLLNILPQPSKPSLAMRSIKLYGLLMRLDAIPNGWYTTLIDQTITGNNLFTQWLSNSWNDLDDTEKSTIQSFIIQRVNNQPTRLPQQLPQLKTYLKMMNVHDSKELLDQRYNFIAQYHAQLIMPNQLNTAAGLEALLLIIDELTGMEGNIPDNLIQIVKNARDVVPHPDLSSQAKGLKIKWGKALSRTST